VSRYWALIPVVFIASLWAWAGVEQSGIQQAGKMPDCTAKSVAAQLRQAIEESPSAQRTAIKVFDVADVASASDSSEERRVCTAMLFTNGGKRAVRFSLEWMTTSRDRIWLQTIE
jgi:hypothetical protein